MVTPIRAPILRELRPYLEQKTAPGETGIKALKAASEAGSAGTTKLTLLNRNIG
jgi:hypothetical protein